MKYRIKISLLLLLVTTGFILTLVIFKIRISRLDNYRLQNDLNEIFNEYLLTIPTISTKEFLSYLENNYPNIKSELEVYKWGVGVRKLTPDTVVLYEYGPDLIDNNGENCLYYAEYRYVDYLLKKDKDILISKSHILGYIKDYNPDDMEIDRKNELENFKRFSDSLGATSHKLNN